MDIFGVPKRDKGWIYLIKNDDLFKIGKSKAPERRLGKDAKTWLPDLEIVAIKPFWNVSYLERALIAGFCRSWYHGEWFRFSSEEDRDHLIDGLREFSDDDRDRNSVDFIYWFNGMGLAELTIEQDRQKLTLPKWLRQESDSKKR